MNNIQQNEGIPEIGSMSMGKSTAANSTGKKSVVTSGRSGGKIPEKKSLMILVGAVIGVVLLVIVGSCILEGMAQRKATEAATIFYTHGLNMASMDLDDVEWVRYYPDEIAETLEENAKYIEESMEMMNRDEIEELREEMEEANVTIEVSLISKLGRKYNNLLTDIAREWIKNEMDLSLSKKDIKISKGYIVWVKMEGYDSSEKKDITCWINCLVLKVNGRYGVYMPMASDSI